MNQQEAKNQQEAHQLKNNILLLPDNPDAKKIETGIFCGACKHGISLRHHSHKIVCTKTLELHEKDKPASCEDAERNGVTCETKLVSIKKNG